MVAWAVEEKVVEALLRWAFHPVELHVLLQPRRQKALCAAVVVERWSIVLARVVALGRHHVVPQHVPQRPPSAQE